MQKCYSSTGVAIIFHLPDWYRFHIDLILILVQLAGWTTQLFTLSICQDSHVRDDNHPG